MESYLYPRIDSLLSLSVRYVKVGDFITEDMIPVDKTDIEFWLGEGKTPEYGEFKSLKEGWLIYEHTLIGARESINPPMHSRVEGEIDGIGLPDVLSSLDVAQYLKNAEGYADGDCTLCLAMGYSSWQTLPDGEWDSEVSILGWFDFRQGRVIENEL